MSSNQCAIYDQKLFMYVKLNESLYQEKQNILRINENLMSENKLLKSLLEKNKAPSDVIKIEKVNFPENLDSQIEANNSRTGLDQLNALINDLKKETEKKLMSFFIALYILYLNILEFNLCSQKKGKIVNCLSSHWSKLWPISERG